MTGWTVTEPPRRDWAHGVWEALAITLAEPLRKAFDRHVVEHGCGTEALHLDDCPEAVELWHLLPDGDCIALARIADTFIAPTTTKDGS